jgi:methionine-rich copper-binding protein CopC
MWGAAIVALLLAGYLAEGHAILKETSPAAGSTVNGPDVPIMLKFNVRVDATRSKLQLMTPDNQMVDLSVEKQNSPDTLNTKATGLKAGDYKIAWQVPRPTDTLLVGWCPSKLQDRREIMVQLIGIFSYLVVLLRAATLLLSEPWRSAGFCFCCWQREARNCERTGFRDRPGG